MTVKQIFIVFIIVFLLSAVVGYLGTGFQPSAVLLFSLKVVTVAGLGGLLLGWLVALRSGRERGIQVVQNYALLVVTSIILFLVAESSLRFIMRDVTTSADVVSYFSKRWLDTHVKYNRLGFREREFDDVKPDGIYRIAIVGDSFTFGQGIDEDTRFSNLIEQALNKSANNQKFQVLNFGKPGADTVDEIGFLDKYVFQANTDFILLQWYVNDPQGHIKLTAFQQYKLLPAHLVRDSILLSLIRREYVTLQHKLCWRGSPMDHIVKLLKDPLSPDSKKATAELQEFIQRCHSHHIDMGMVLFGDSYFDDESARDFLVDRVMSFCHQEDIMCVDMRDPLMPYQGNKILWASIMDPHPSAFANKIAAESILDMFGNAWKTAARQLTQPSSSIKPMTPGKAEPVNNSV